MGVGRSVPLAEPFGLVAAEAIVRGVPVVASLHGGLAEIVEPGRTGLLFPNGDEAELARCLEAVGSGNAFGDGSLPEEVVRGARDRLGVGRYVARIESIALELRERRRRIS